MGRHRCTSGLKTDTGRVSRLLLRGNANPQLTRSNPERGWSFVPLGAAVMEGHSEVVGELVQQCGCGGASKGVQALEMAAIKRYLDIMALLTDAGVVDNGIALISAIRFKSERSVRFLLQQKEGKPIGDQASYANFKDKRGLTPLLCALGISSFPSSPRMVRSLVDAGVDTASVVITVEAETGGARVTPLGLTNRVLRDKKIVRDGEELTEKQLVRREGTRPLLLRVEAVHAGSWLWPVDTSSILGTAAEGTARTAVVALTPLRRMLPLLRRRARRPRVLLAALCRSRREDVIAREGADPPGERPDRARRPPPRTSKQSRTEEPSESEIAFMWNPGAARDQPSAWTTLVQECRLALKWSLRTRRRAFAFFLLFCV
ncbi:unnamed protein product [Ectocarpus sp. 13 AM-2016]